MVWLVGLGRFIGRFGSVHGRVWVSFQFESVHGRVRSVLSRFMVGLGQFGSVHGRVGSVWVGSWSGWVGSW